MVGPGCNYSYSYSFLTALLLLPKDLPSCMQSSFTAHCMPPAAAASACLAFDVLQVLQSIDMQRNYSLSRSEHCYVRIQLLAYNGHSLWPFGGIFNCVPHCQKGYKSVRSGISILTFLRPCKLLNFPLSRKQRLYSCTGSPQIASIPPAALHLPLRTPISLLSEPTRSF